MATLEQFQGILTRIDSATTNIAADLRKLKDQITGQGLPSDVEEEILAQLEAKAVALESIAGETPEDEEEPTEPVDEE